MAVDSHLRKIFGDEVRDSFQSSKILLVGAGGIGCELLKDLMMMYYGEIHVLDLDTIDLSNLNRQFLFRQKDIKASKALTAVQAVKHFNHGSKLVAHHGNIMDTKEFPLSFFEQFDVVFNALDNLEARMYVNKVCLFTKIPLMESGTTGLKGQVEPIYPYETECFACLPKSTPKSFPVCTIRSTPSKPVHCITWAKQFLFPQLFGESAEEDASANGDASQSAEEKENSKREASELGVLKKRVADSSISGDVSYVDDIVKRVFKDDIEKLLQIENLWKSHEKPTPLDTSKYTQVTKDEVKRLETMKLSDQDVWSIQENLSMFAQAAIRLAKRLYTEKVIDFDKDDDDTLQFVTTASNIRSFIFGIPLKSEFDIKQIAGNIIPAVATTNAVMAGFSGLASIHYFLAGKNSKKAAAASRHVCDSTSKDLFVNSFKLDAPSVDCKMCSVTRGVADLDLEKVTLGQFREALISKYGYEDDVSIATSDSRLLYDYDFEDNLEKLLSTFVKSDDVVLVSDSEETLDLVELLLDQHDGEPIKLPDLRIPPFKSAEKEEDDAEEAALEQDGAANGVIDIDDDEPEEVGTMSKKRSADGDVEENPEKKQRVVIQEHDELLVLD